MNHWKTGQTGIKDKYIGSMLFTPACPAESGAFQQHDNGTGTAIGRFGLTEGNHIRALDKPFVNELFQDRFLIDRPETFPVNDADTADTPDGSTPQEFNQHFPCLIPAQTMQIELVADDPVTAPQFPDNVRTDPILGIT